MITGLLPAAGNASRFSGIMKELLPLGNNTLIGRSVNTLYKGGAGRLVVATNINKIAIHSVFLSGYNPAFVFQTEPEILGAVRAMLPHCTELNYFTMPDTYIPSKTFQREFRSQLSIGVFKTNKPERFGVIKDGRVYDKQNLTGEHYAWGVLVWSRLVADFWMSHKFDNFAQAISAAMSEYGYEAFPLDFYIDVANFEEYRKLCALN